MDSQEIIMFINSVGFPILCCIVLFKQNGKLTDAIAQLNATLIEIKTKIEGGNDK